ncbi:MAG: DUF922 domain-containing protein [Thermodesulfovibrionales bacterium]|nr:DUF922 domain-containing protein [Thermodesulfovibrionales bacterium]
MTIVRLILILGLLLALPSVIHATVFQYFDEDGTLIITDSPDGWRQVKPKRFIPDKEPLKQPEAGKELPKTVKLDYKKDVQYNYYPVTGRNLQEVVASADRNGPFDSKESRTYPAQTRWRLGWSYDFDYSFQREGEYIHVALNMFDIKLNSDITVILPMISEGTELDPHDLELWGKYVKGLLEHENDHVRITTDPLYWDEARKTISGVKELTLPYDGHSDMDSVIKDTVKAETGKMGHNLMKAIKMRNDEYDRVTEHGLKPEMRDVFFSR